MITPPSRLPDRPAKVKLLERVLDARSPDNIRPQSVVFVHWEDHIGVEWRLVIFKGVPFCGQRDVHEMVADGVEVGVVTAEYIGCNGKRHSHSPIETHRISHVVEFIRVCYFLVADIHVRCDFAELLGRHEQPAKAGFTGAEQILLVASRYRDLRGNRHIWQGYVSFQEVVFRAENDVADPRFRAPSARQWVIYRADEGVRSTAREVRNDTGKRVCAGFDSDNWDDNPDIPIIRYAVVAKQRINILLERNVEVNPNGI